MGESEDLHRLLGGLIKGIYGRYAIILKQTVHFKHGEGLNHRYQENKPDDNHMETVFQFLL